MNPSDLLYGFRNRMEAGVLSNCIADAGSVIQQ